MRLPFAAFRFAPARETMNGLIHGFVLFHEAKKRFMILLDAES
jgi:hypothetical protein